MKNPTNCEELYKLQLYFLVYVCKSAVLHTHTYVDFT